MRYDYHCTSCEEVWEETQLLNDRDLPLSLPCPKCQAVDSVKRGFFSVARISYEGQHSVLTRAGSGWNDLLTGIKKASGRDATIHTR